MADNPLGQVNPDAPNPRNFDVGAQPQNQLGNQPSPTQAAPQVPAPPNPQQVAAAADTAHHYSIGKMVKSLFGSERNYQVNPETGKTEAVDTPMSGGQIFRNMVAGVLLGGAAGRNEKSGVKGFVAGGEAEVKEQQRQDQQKQEAARKDYQQNLEARREQREETVSKAHIALMNAQTLRENQIMQREDIDWHQRKALEGEAQIAALEKIPGVRRMYRDISESDKNELLRKNPDAIHLMWRPTGTTIVKNPDGSFGHEETYSAITAPTNLRIKIPEADRVQWKKDGVEQYFGEIPKDATVGYNEYLNMSQLATKLRNDKDEITKQNQESREREGRIKESEAHAKLFAAEATRARAEAAKAAKEDTEPKLIARAWETLSRPADSKKDGKGGAGGDFSKLDIEDQMLLRKDMSKQAESKEKLLGTLLQTGQGGTKEAADLYNDINLLTDMSALRPKSAGVVPPNVNIDKINNAISVMKEDSGVDPDSTDAYRYVKSLSGLSSDEQDEMMKRTRAIIPWQVVEAMAKANGVTQSKASEELKKQGFSVEVNPKERVNITTPPEYMQ